MTCNLCFESDFITYIKKLKQFVDSGGIAIICVRDTIGHKVGNDGYLALKQLGLTKLKDDSQDNLFFNHWRGYIAVIQSGKVIFEDMADVNKSVRFKESIGKKEYDILSSPLNSACISSILVDGTEYSLNMRGINIVAINNEGIVRDSVNFDTHDKLRLCHRNKEQFEIEYKGRIKDSLIVRNPDEIIERLDFNSIIKHFNLNQVQNNIHVRIYFWGLNPLLTALETVLDELYKDNKIDLLIVYAWKNTKLITTLESKGFPAVHVDEYDLKNDSVDIAIYNDPVNYNLGINTSAMKVYLNGALVNGMQGIRGANDLVDWLCRDKQSLMDYIIVPEHVYKLISNATNVQIEKWHAFDNPKFDIIFQHLSNINIPDAWNKIKGKKCILWAFDHNYNTNGCTFDLYIAVMIDFFAKHDDFGLIIRPHDSYIDELLAHGIWSKQDLQMIKDACRNSSNIIWDDSKDYGMAYSIADAVITDINCGITISAMTLDKPMAVFQRNGEERAESQYSDVLEGIIKISNVEDMVDFIEMVGRGEDFLRSKRENYRKKYIGCFDGNNGQRIKEFIMQKYEEKIK